MLGYLELYGGLNVTKILFRSSAISRRNMSSTICIRIVVFDTIVWSSISCVGSCTTPVCLRKNSKQDCPRSLLQNPHSRVLRRCEPQPHRRRVAVYLVTHFIWSKGGLNVLAFVHIARQPLLDLTFNFTNISQFNIGGCWIQIHQLQIRAHFNVLSCDWKILTTRVNPRIDQAHKCHDRIHVHLINSGTSFAFISFI